METPTYGHFLEGGGRGDRQYRGAAKSTRPPALLPGGGADDTTEEGPPGCPCNSSHKRMPYANAGSQSERRQTPSRPPWSRRGWKTTLPRDTPRRRAPQAPTPTIFWPFLRRYAPVWSHCSLELPRALRSTSDSQTCFLGQLSYAFCCSWKRGVQPFLQTISMPG